MGLEGEEVLKSWPVFLKIRKVFIGLIGERLKEIVWDKILLVLEF